MKGALPVGAAVTATGVTRAESSGMKEGSLLWSSAMKPAGVCPARISLVRSP